MTLNAYEWGEPDTATVVCLHGVSSYGGRFDGLAEPLADRYHVIALDLLGHGHSPWQPPWDVGAHLDAILATVPDGPAIWIGHSFGGRLAAELAAREPDRVERVVLLDPALRVLPQVALDLAELERSDVSYATVEEAVQVRYDNGRVLLAPREAGDRVRPRPHGARPRRPPPLPLLQERGDRGLERHGERAAGAGEGADAVRAGRRLVAHGARRDREVPGRAGRSRRGGDGPGRPHRLLGRARRRRKPRSRRSCLEPPPRSTAAGTSSAQSAAPATSRPAERDPGNRLFPP